MKKIFLLLILIFWPSFLWAAPSITGYTGTPAHGNELVVSGSSFGTGPTIHKWDDFEGETHTVGQDVGAGPGATAWSFNRAAHAKVSNTVCRTNSTKHALSDFDAQDAYAIGFQYAHGDTLSPIYVTWWWRWDSQGYEASANWKPHWPVVYENATPQQPRVSMCGQSEVSYCYGIDAGTHETPEVVATNCDPFPAEDEWIRYEFFGIESDADTANGTVVFLVQEENGGTFVTVFEYEGNIETHHEAAYHWTGCNFADYDSSKNYAIYTDDVYIANSRARVEIGDKSTWAACTQREIQIPSAWAADEITFTVNAGSITNPADGNYYLYVVDADGAVNENGYQLTSQPSMSGIIMRGSGF